MQLRLISINLHQQRWEFQIGPAHPMSSLGASLHQIQWRVRHYGGQILTIQCRGCRVRWQERSQTWWCVIYFLDTRRVMLLLYCKKSIIVVEGSEKKKAEALAGRGPWSWVEGANAVKSKLDITDTVKILKSFGTSSRRTSAP